MTRSPDKATYDCGEIVTLTPNPEPCYSFTNWSGDLTGSANPATLTMDGNKTVTANFSKIQYTLTVNATHGTVTRSPDKAAYDCGEIVTLTPNPEPCYSFTNWSGDLTGSANPATLTMDGNKTVTANFSKIQYTLTVNATNGTVTRSPNKAAYDCGEIVTLTPNPEACYSFTSWSGDLTGSANPATLTMDGNKTVTANSSKIQYTLTVNATNGTVTRSPNKAAYDCGEIVTLTPNPEACYSFTNWSGDLTGSANPATLTMDGNKTVTANFSKIQYTLTVDATNGTVTRSPNKAAYDCGEIVTLTPNPEACYSFTNWSGDLTGSANPATLTMDGNKTVTANFSKIQYTLTVDATNGTVTRSPNKTSYDCGDIVTLTPIPDSCYSFTNWSGDLSGTANPATITMDGNKTVTANFNRSRYTLTVNATNGIVTRSPDKTSYDCGETVSLQATPDTDYHFTDWSGDLTGSTNPATITMNGNKTVTANFAKGQVTLTVAFHQGWHGLAARHWDVHL